MTGGRALSVTPLMPYGRVDCISLFPPATMRVNFGSGAALPSGSFYGVIQDLLARMSVDRHQGEEKSEDEGGRQVGDLRQG